MRVGIDASDLRVKARHFLKYKVPFKKLFQRWDKDFRSTRKKFFKTNRGIFFSGPLNPAYEKKKASQGYGTKPLVRTGDLVKGLTLKANKDHIFRHAGNSGEVGSRNPVAKFLAKRFGYLKKPVRTRPIKKVLQKEFYQYLETKGFM